MEEQIKRWLFDPTVGKLIAALISLGIVYALRRLAQRSLGRYVTELDTRYRVRKFVTFLGYLISIAELATIFSDRLAGLTVAFGVAGAGIAVALQEVIASVAGWVAAWFGGFYSPGDRVQLGGIKGDVIEICGDYAVESLAAWKEAVSKYRLEPARIEPMITLVANDNWIEFTAGYILDYRKRRFVKGRLFTRILEEVDKSNNQIRLASATFELVNLPRLDIKFAEGTGAINPEYVP